MNKIAVSLDRAWVYAWSVGFLFTLGFVSAPSFATLPWQEQIVALIALYFLWPVELGNALRLRWPL